MLNYTIAEIKLKLHGKIMEVVRYLLPHGKRMGNEWIAGDAHGSTGKSLKVHLEGDKIGIWSDFATGDSGDIINLWCITRNISFSGAISEMRQKIGINITPNLSMSNVQKNYVKPQLPKISTDVSNEHAIQYLVDKRKLTLETINKYRIITDSNQILFPYYRNNQLIMIKYLNIIRDTYGKKDMRVSANCEPCLFGWQAIPVGDIRSVVIVEGEIDAMTLSQYEIPHVVLSVPYGGGTADKQKWILSEFENLAIYEKIYLCMDNDKSGQEATMEIMDRLGRHRCNLVRLPYKDANECLQNNVSAAEINTCFVDAVSPDPVNFKYFSNFSLDSESQFIPPDGIVPGYKLPWPTAANKVLFRQHELSIWTGSNGHGKSQLLGQVMLGFMKQGAKVCIASMEMLPGYVLHNLVIQTAAMEMPTREYRAEIYKWYDDKGWMFNVTGTAKVDEMLETFEYAARKYGVDVFLIDSFLKCGIAEDDYKAQKHFVEQLCDFTQNNHCHIHLIVHPRKSADESHIPGKLDMRGTGAVSDLASNCFCVWRNKHKEEVVAKHISKNEAVPQAVLEDIDCLLRCDKQRSSRWEGKIPLWFNASSLTYVERYNQRPSSIVEYSNVVQMSKFNV